MPEFIHSSYIAASAASIWRFFARPDAPVLLTPPWQPVTVLRHEAGLKIGAIAEYCLQLGPVPVRWVTQQTACLHQRLFVEETREGPVQSWVLRHELEPVSHSGTYQTATATYRLYGDAAADFLLAPWTNARLRDMFDYRHRVICSACERSQQTARNLTQ